MFTARWCAVSPPPSAPPDDMPPTAKLGSWPKLGRAALHRFHFQVNSLLLHDCQLVLPLPSTNQPPEQFVVNNIITELRLLPNDQWKLDHFQAVCLGAKINLSGTLTNASAVRNW